MDAKKMMFYRCCFGYMISGMVVLVIGAILPSLIRDAGISYTVAGGLLSVMAIGNLLASFVFPLIESWIGKRTAITVITMMVPVCYFCLTLLPPVSIMYLLFFLAGIARGSITILNNIAVNQISNNSTRMLNFLHCSFAIGAFLAPFLAAVLIKMGVDWRGIIYLLIGLSFLSSLSYATLNYDLIEVKRFPALNKNKSNTEVKGSGKDRSFLKSVDFYCISFVLFFYLGVENCINGWFVTYLQSTGIMTEAFATTLVSITWLVIMVGRLICAALSKRYSKSAIVLMNAVGSGICFFLLISTKNLYVITAALLGMGLFLAGIYPTCVANAGRFIKGSTLGMSLLTAISAVGGIIAPQLVGGAADRIGIVPAISILAFNMIVVILLSIVNYRRIRETAV